MPIYAYRCSSCGHEKDVLRKLSDAPLTQCPECGKDTFSKQVTAAGFQLKGSGWYVTDFRGGNNGQGSKSASAGSDKTADSADSSSSGADSSANSKSNDSASSSNSASSTSSSSAPAADAPKPSSSAGAA